MEERFELDTPLNTGERYLYGINVRLSILIEQMSSLLEHIATKDAVAIQSTKEDLEVIIDQTNDIIEEVTPPVQKKRAPKKV